MTTVSVIGGDLRQTTVAKLMQEDGYITKIYGFEKALDKCGLDSLLSLDESINSDIIILPVPISYDGVTLNAPFSEEEIQISDVLNNIGENTFVLAGKIPDSIKKEINDKGGKFADYLEREEMTIKNAIATSEGAIQIAMEEMPITLWGSKCLIIGYGRIGKALSKMLAGIGAKLSISARKCSDIAWIEERGYNAIHTNYLDDYIGYYDIIFNTVPSLILDKEKLLKIKKDALIIDLASKPGGVDFLYAKDIGRHVIWALSLPGKVAPVTSGKIIKDTVINIINEWGCENEFKR